MSVCVCVCVDEYVCTTLYFDVMTSSLKALPQSKPKKIIIDRFKQFFFTYFVTRKPQFSLCNDPNKDPLNPLI